ncbi:hypothetical protein MTQ00_09180 [Chryseobacterium sp. B21-037]|uniref:hypothetical protein n=1 Tax=Chryseobacterium sp. B21-037 TaxID=2926038 RepID=UPI0023599FD7|nr:hypothetical protein [Chryseobacterium sp. B21-037]MDC8104711.1 hypothetical protein [Chryseobacterium sp. B21-037]
MWLKKFFQIIDKTPIGKFVDKKIELIESTDPDRIYVENIRSFFNLTTPIAKILCEMAVKDKLFKKKVGIECPSCGRIINTYNSTSEIPQKIKCDTCELLEKEDYLFPEVSVNKITFYQLNNIAHD